MACLLHAFIGIAACFVLLSGAVDAAGNCSQLAPISVYQANVGYVIHPLRVEAFPAINRMRAAAFGIKWVPTVMMERNRSMFETSGVPATHGQCSYPTGLSGNPYLNDPTKGCSSGSKVPCGAIVQQILFDDMDCTSAHGVDIFHGVERQYWTILYSHPLFPNYTVEFTAALVNQSVTVYPFNDPTNPDALKYEYTYGRLKFGYDFKNFPWSNPNASVISGSENKAPFFYAAFATDVSIGQGIITLTESGNSLVVNYTASNGTAALLLGVDNSVVVDGIPYAQPFALNKTTVLNFTSEFMGTPKDPNLVLETDGWSHMHICDPDVGLWTNATFDPFLGALFSEGPSPPGSKSSKAGLIGGLVAMAVVVIAIAIFITLILTVPSLKETWIYPNRRKHQTQRLS